MTNRLIKISKLAKDLGVTTTTLYNWRRKGQIEFVKSNTGLNYVTLETYNYFLGIQDQEKPTVVYCRISSPSNKKNMKTQKERVVNYCNAKGYKVEKVIEEYGSGINDNRPRLQTLLRNQEYSRIVVEHKDRLTRFGFNYIETLLKYNNITIEVINNVDTDEEDIIQDFVSIITSYCARIYGKRRSKRKTEQLIKELKNDKK